MIKTSINGRTIIIKSSEDEVVESPLPPIIVLPKHYALAEGIVRCMKAARDVAINAFQIKSGYGYTPSITCPKVLAVKLMKDIFGNDLTLLEYKLLIELAIKEEW